MRRTLSAFWAQLRTAFALTTTYRAEMVLWALSGTLPIILMGVWSEAARTGDLPYSQVDVVRYFVAVLVVRQLTFVWVIWEFEEDIVHGRLSSALLRPIGPVWNYVANHVAERIVRFPLVLALVGLCFWLHPESTFFPSLQTLAIAVPLIVSSFAVRFLLQYAFSMLCFFVERASSLESLTFILYVFFSGMLAPLDLYPPWVATVAAWTPFPYFVYVPAQVLMGQAVDLTQAFLGLGAWGLGLLIVQQWLWRRGLAQYSAMGA